ncbi:MAG TPA: transcriptional regulator, partial [Thermoanaerobaculia bacterium]
MSRTVRSAPDPRLELRVLGPLELRRDGRALELPRSRKTRALLGYLALRSAPATRAHMCDLLWEDVADPRANLRWSLSKLRGLADGGRWLLAEGSSLALDRTRL